MTIACAVCGTEHDEEALELGYRRPDAVIDLDAATRAAGVFENDDLCVIDAKRFFVRATLPLPVNGRGGNYQIGVWVEVASSDFDRIGKLWTDPGQAAEPPMSATLANEVRLHPDSLGQALLLQLTGPKTRPQVFVRDATYSLGAEQRHGISAHRASEYSVGLRAA
jgi:hypothetical protein